MKRLNGKAITGMTVCVRHWNNQAQQFSWGFHTVSLLGAVHHPEISSQNGNTCQCPSLYRCFGRGGADGIIRRPKFTWLAHRRPVQHCTHTVPLHTGRLKSACSGALPSQAWRRLKWVENTKSHYGSCQFPQVWWVIENPQPDSAGRADTD